MIDYYELKYRYNNHEVIHRMPADITTNEMYYFIREFLLGCSWQPDAVDKIIGKEE